MYLEPNLFSSPVPPPNSITYFIKIAVQIIEHCSEIHKNDRSGIVLWPTGSREIREVVNRDNTDEESRVPEECNAGACDGAGESGVAVLPHEISGDKYSADGVSWPVIDGGQ